MARATYESGFAGFNFKNCQGCGVFLGWVAEWPRFGVFCDPICTVRVHTENEERDRIICTLFTELNVHKKVLGDLFGMSRQNLQMVLVKWGATPTQWSPEEIEAMEVLGENAPFEEITALARKYVIDKKRARKGAPVDDLGDGVVPDEEGALDWQADPRVVPVSERGIPHAVFVQGVPS